MRQKPKLTIYVFGNPDYPQDAMALKIARQLGKIFPDIDFVLVKPNQDLPFIDEKEVFILDTIAGIDEITLIEDKDLDKLITSASTTVHDFDLGFQLKYLKKLDRVGKVTIIGLPMEKPVLFSEVEKIIEKINEGASLS